MVLMPLQEYDKLAYAYIKKYGYSWMLEGQYFGTIVSFLIEADMKYDPENKSKCSLKTYRIGACKIALHQIFDEKNKLSGRKSLDNIDVEDRPVKKQQSITKYLTDPVLTKKQSQYMKHKYIDKMSIVEIAEKYKVTKNCIRNLISIGIKKLRSKYSVLEKKEVD